MSTTILVVDDDESIRELLRLHLASAGYEVHVAADAISAGYMVLRGAPDLISRLIAGGNVSKDVQLDRRRERERTSRYP